jgi:uncharacterized protein with HEPN domain
MSAKRDWRLLVEDVLEAAEKIEQYTRGMDFETFASNSLVADAVIRNLMIVGEAARHVPPDVQARCPEIDWRRMNDMRNILIHAYAEVNLTIVWSTLRGHLPPAANRLRRLLEEEGTSDE